MSQHKKTIEKLRKRPINNNIRFADVESLLLKLGFSYRQRGSSHVVFEQERLPHICIKKQQFLASYSVEDVRNMLDLLEVKDDV